jgi:hypothetical protein
MKMLLKTYSSILALKDLGAACIVPCVPRELLNQSPPSLSEGSEGVTQVCLFCISHLQAAVRGDLHKPKGILQTPHGLTVCAAHRCCSFLFSFWP